jgi:hypothetical protein
MTTDYLFQIDIIIIRYLSLLLIGSSSHALARSILPTANIAKLVLAPTGHVIAAFIFLDPELAIGALFEFSALDQHHKLAVGLIHVCQLLVVLAAHPRVHLALAGQTVVLLAGRALVVVQSSVESEHRLAAGSGAPTGISHVLLDVVLEHELIVFLAQLLG